MTQPSSPVENIKADANETTNSNLDTLANRLRARIMREGAITFCEWMRAALYDERGGYYQRRDRARWGREGDYRTSPERSTLFAATFARYFVKLFTEFGRPRELIIIEAGGGAGHFARGILSTIERDAPNVFSHLRYIFVEASGDARARASELLAPFAGRVELRNSWENHTSVETGIIFSNELLDALPVHRVVFRNGRLLELYVGLDAGGRFVWVERESSTARLAAHFADSRVSLEEGQLAEVNLEAEAWIESAAQLLERGYVVTVDYGAEAEYLYGAPHRREGTLRAFRSHAFATDTLAQPGEQDLTTTVNWTQIRKVGEQAGLKTISHERQDTFLLRVGLLEQLECESALAQSEAEVVSLRLDAREMILPGGISEHFQVLVQKKDAGV